MIVSLYFSWIFVRNIPKKHPTTIHSTFMTVPNKAIIHQLYLQLLKMFHVEHFVFSIKKTDYKHSCQSFHYCSNNEINLSKSSFVYYSISILPLCLFCCIFTSVPNTSRNLSS